MKSFKLASTIFRPFPAQLVGDLIKLKADEEIVVYPCINPRIRVVREKLTTAAIDNVDWRLLRDRYELRLRRGKGERIAGHGVPPW